MPERLKAAGLHVERHDDHFGENTKDVEWYPLVGSKGWLALTHDKGQFRRSDERDAAMRAGVPLFIVGGKMKHDELAEFVAAMAHKIAACRDRNSPPFIAKVTRRPTTKSRTHPRRVGKVVVVLTLEQWQKELRERRKK